MTTTPAFIVKQATASKTGARANGTIGYQILTNAARTELMLMITSNEGGGNFSNEIVPFANVTDSLKGVKAAQPFPAKTLKSAFKGKSANNPGFMAAILRAEGLTTPAPEASSQHVQAGDWKAWSAGLLAQEGVPYVPPAPPAATACKTPDAAMASGVTSATEPKSESARSKGKGGKAGKDDKAPAEKPSSGSKESAHENPAP